MATRHSLCHVFCYGLADIDAKLKQLAMNPWRRTGNAHLGNELANIRGSWLAARIALAWVESRSRS
jgi:hypothetical protein